MRGFKQHGKAQQCDLATSPTVDWNFRNTACTKGEVMGSELDATAMASRLRQELRMLESAGETGSMALPLLPPGDLGKSTSEVVGHKLDAGTTASLSMSLPLPPSGDLGKSTCEVVGRELDVTAMASRLRQELVMLESAGETRSMSLPLRPPGDFRNFGEVGNLRCSLIATNVASELYVNASATSCRSERLSCESALDSKPIALPSPPGYFFTNLGGFGDLWHSLATTSAGLNCDSESLAACYGQEQEPIYSAVDLPFPSGHSGVDSSECQHPPARLGLQMPTADPPWPLHHGTPMQDASPVISTNFFHGPESFGAMVVREVPSVGSLGHPQNCNAPCKFTKTPRGCKDGEHCLRCHLCRWTRSSHHGL
eukprot:TRINITY_DN35064_c0_g2_i1.p1 TRINITY_DN35064_c0_g2~~TRINITY_DN35064_c0_g2_i1.p1  ORF type:complete len:369 (-),score=50.34 TRINITY_DN35064_c0_g2_i1:136-1242(-)